MTNKQYERIGRALVAVARLNAANDRLYDLKDKLIKDLETVVGIEAAGDFVENSYGELFPDIHVANKLAEMVAAIAIRDEEAIHD